MPVEASKKASLEAKRRLVENPESSHAAAEQMLTKRTLYKFVVAIHESHPLAIRDDVFFCSWRITEATQALVRWFRYVTTKSEAHTSKEHVAE